MVGSRANTLFCGDNLAVLRHEIADASVDLVYLDPPFNSAANYNVLFKSPDGKANEASIEAFDDTWHLGNSAAQAYEDVLTSGHGNAAMMLRAMRGALGENDMMAYLAMMAVRLIELHRVLKPTGSLYLHCDPTASHYPKIILDGVFGLRSFRNEIVWKLTTVHNDSQSWSRVHDIILFYTKAGPADFTWTDPREPHAEAYVTEKYRHDDGNGRLYRFDNMTSPSPRPRMTYVWMGFPPPAYGWRYEPETMQRLHDEGRI